MQLAVIYGHEDAYTRLGALLGPIATGTFGRALFRQVVKLVPVAGDAAAGAIAAAGTYAVGMTALKVFHENLAPEAVEQILDDEIERAFAQYKAETEESR